MKKINSIYFIILNFFALNLLAQEFIAPLQSNVNLLMHPLKSKNHQAQKTMAIYDTLPFFDDFYYAPNTPFATGQHWSDSSVYINTGFAKAPPSVGVATFDGLNRYGYPYNITAPSQVSYAADTLTSRPISLYSQSGYTYSPADSIGLTFLYQRQGFGENPYASDSLIVDFYKPLYPVVTGTTTTYGYWFRVWSTRGTNNPPAFDSTFKRAFIRIKDTAYFHDGFKFRFRNKSNGSGNVDHWNVDYVNLKKNYFRVDTVYNEVALGYMPRPILKNYSAMPYYQYNSLEMGSKFSNFIRNNNVGVTKNTNYEYSIIDAGGNVLSTYGAGSSNTGNANPFVTRGWDSVLTHKNPPVNYTISPLTDSTHFYVKHVVTSNPDVWKYNDTIYQRLEFNNFYAYDDGSVEAAYYLNQPGSKTALRYTLNVTDTLRALDILFTPFYDGVQVQGSSFRMYVWSEGGGKPGTVILRDSLKYPKYLKLGYNQPPRYFLTSPLILNPGTYYFGFQQTSNQPLYLGLDRNFDHSSSAYYDVSGTWQQSAIKGSLFIHPVLGPAARALVGIDEIFNTPKESLIKIYPNPANDKITIASNGLNLNNNYTIELYNTLGSMVTSAELSNGERELSVADYPAGLYFVVLKQNNSVLSQKKIIISR